MNFFLCSKEKCRIARIKQAIASQRSIEWKKIDLYWEHKFLRNDFPLHDFWHTKNKCIVHQQKFR